MSTQWGRILLSGLTTIYFILSITRFLAQIIFQFRAFHTNNRAAMFLYSILVHGNATGGFTVLGKDGLRLCHSVPRSFSTGSCTLLNTTLHSGPFPTPSSTSTKSGIFFSTQASQTSPPISVHHVSQGVSVTSSDAFDPVATSRALSTPTRTVVVIQLTPDVPLPQALTTPTPFTRSVVFNSVQAAHTIVVTELISPQDLAAPTPFVTARSEGRMDRDNGHLDHRRHEVCFGR